MWKSLLIFLLAASVVALAASYVASSLGLEGDTARLFVFLFGFVGGLAPWLVPGLVERWRKRK